MKSSPLHHITTFTLHSLLFFCCFFYALILKSDTGHSPLPAPAILSNVTGNIWVEVDGNATYNGEHGPSNVLVLLYSNETDTIVSQALTVDGVYEFNGIDPGKYFIRIDDSAFEFGGSLFNKQSCLGTNDANNMVDNDDNGSDTTPNAVSSTSFTLTDEVPATNVPIEHVDFCFLTSCDEPNPLVFPTCEEITSLDIICDITGLDGLCAIMPSDSSAGVQPSPLCDGFSASENISWLAFAASDGLYSINIFPFECQFGTIGQEGFQVGIYTDCTFSESVFCNNFCTTNTINISSELLNPGQVYYLYINGCNGSVCNYRIDINGTPTSASLEPTDVCIFSDGDFQCEDIDYCTDSNILFQGQDITHTGSFTWSITTLSGNLYLGDSIVTTEKNALILNMPSVGTYSVCLTNVVNGCPDQAWNGVVCREVSTSFAVPMPQDEDFGEFFVCEGEFDEFTIDEFANEDPNGDGDFGWNTVAPDYMFGLNVGTVSTPGCSYEQQFTVSPSIPSPVEDVLISVCQEDLPIMIDGFSLNALSFGNSQTFVLENYLLVNSQDQNGCDSIINLTVEKLNIFPGFLLSSSCTIDGVLLEFDYFADLSTDVEFLEFVWKDPSGDTIPNGPDLLSVVAPFESGNGEYTLDVIINKNGVVCEYSYSTFFDVELFLPPTPIISGPSIICMGDDPSVYTAQTQENETMFVWSFPNNVASAVVSGMFDEVITIDWAGTNGGEVSAIRQNSCGQSDQTSLDVEVIPLATRNFSLDSSICIDNSTIISFTGSNLNIVDYTWDFDGGTIISGSGIGPYEVSWVSSGEKLVSLFTTDTNGCISETTTKSILVKLPLTPPDVSCNTSLGEIEFFWQIPLMVSGFEVNVLSGQTGGVFMANSFIISGLEAGEEVTIELLTELEDSTCDQFLSTIVTCQALLCLPPDIELSADQNACSYDENITIEASITSGETGSGIFTGPGIIDASNGVFDPSVANIGINTILYSFTSDIAGCTGTETISIEVYDPPISSFIQDQETICILDMLTLDYNGTPNVDDFNWNFDGGVGSGLITNQSVVFDTPGLKNLSLQVTKDGCTSDVFATTVMVDPELDDVIVQCDTASTDFVVFSWDAISGVSLFQITVDNNPPFFTPNTTITVDNLEEDQEVMISVLAISNTSCPRTAGTEMCKTTKTPVSVENQLLSNIKIYPNPVLDLLYFEGIVEHNLTYQLYSSLGSKLKYGVISNTEIDLADIPRGIYFLRLMDKSSNLYRDFKVVKE